MRTAILTTIAMLISCGGDDPTRQRYSNPQGGYSLYYSDRWIESPDAGSIRFQPSTSNSKKTIVIRSSTRPTEIVEGKPTTQEDIFAATEKVLGALPGASLTEKERVKDAKLPGARFSLTFVPTGRGIAEKYQRTHVTLVGSKRIFHITFTAPASDSFDERAFQQIVSTLEEA